jgi:hypothetical protein
LTGELFEERAPPPAQNPEILNPQPPPIPAPNANANANNIPPGNFVFLQAQNNPVPQNPALQQPFGGVQKMNTVKAMGNVMTNWRRTFSFKNQTLNENCCICLEDFNKGDDIIQLHCNPAHTANNKKTYKSSILGKPVYSILNASKTGHLSITRAHYAELIL